MLNDFDIIKLREQGKDYNEIIDENKVVVVLMNVNATGYYSEAEYDASVAMTVDDFRKYYDNLKDFHTENADGELEGFDVAIPELDGKHSQTETTATMTMYTEADIVVSGELKTANDDFCEYIEDKIFDGIDYREYMDRRNEIEDNLNKYLEKFEGDIQVDVLVIVPEKYKGMMLGLSNKLADGKLTAEELEALMKMSKEED